MLSSHLCQLHRRGADIRPLLDAFLAEHHGRSLRSLICNSPMISENPTAYTGLVLIHIKELSPDWWEDTKSWLQQAALLDNERDNGVEASEELKLILATLDEAGPCKDCPTQLEFRGDNKRTTDRLG